MINRLGGPYTESLGRRIVVVGDIHGEAEGLREILFAAGVTSSVDSCEWKARVPDEPGMSVSTLLTAISKHLILYCFPSYIWLKGLHLVQLGDIVDRGEESLAAYRCLNELQDTVPAGYQVTRLLGNHDIWWLSGQLHMRHPQVVP